MSAGFRAVQWNRDKRIYDGILLAAIAVYIAGFILIGAWTSPSARQPRLDRSDGSAPSAPAPS